MHGLEDSKFKAVLWTGNGLPFDRVTRFTQYFEANSFIATLAIAVIQGAFVLHRYRSNPTLAVPPGLTHGIEDARFISKEKERFKSHYFVCDDFVKNSIKSVESTAEKKSLSPLKKERNKKEERMKTFSNGKIQKLFGELNKFLVLLVPWLTTKINFMFQKRAHLFHIGFIMSLLSIRKVNPFGRARKQVCETMIPFNYTNREYLNVVVIGDSLACGIGCVNIWDKDAPYAPKKRIEFLSSDRKKNVIDPNDHKSHNSSNGPVFPRIFARTLSHRLQYPVMWRSAGVDGGDVLDIQTHCMGVIEEEVQRGQSPDVVIVLCGLNDLKKIIAKPFCKPWAKSHFQSGLMKVVNDIHTFAPESKILFPALPTCKLDKKSIVNIFPLSFFLDIMISIWDWQKKCVADSSPSTTYLGLTMKDIAEWYRNLKGHEKEFDHSLNSLISVDGIHPNSRCYAHWGELMANKFCNHFE